MLLDWNVWQRNKLQATVPYLKPIKKTRFGTEIEVKKNVSTHVLVAIHKDTYNLVASCNTSGQRYGGYFEFFCFK